MKFSLDGILCEILHEIFMPRGHKKRMKTPRSLRRMPWSPHEKFHVYFPVKIPWGIKPVPLFCRIAHRLIPKFYVCSWRNSRLPVTPPFASYISLNLPQKENGVRSPDV